MTALNFPATPSDGDTFDNYIYDGVKEVWRIQPNIPGISSRFKVSATAPTNPADGEVWLNSTDGNTYIYYSDGDTAQWIEIGGTTGNPPDLDSLNDVTITSPTTDQLLRWNGTAWVNGTANTNSIADGAVTAPKLAKTAGAVMVFDDATARTTAIPTPVEGMTTYLKDTDLVEVFDGSDFVPVAIEPDPPIPPAILQVQSVTKRNTFTTASSSFTDITDLFITITPSSASSRFIITLSVHANNDAGSRGAAIRVTGGNADTFIGDAAGSRIRALTGGFHSTSVFGTTSHTFVDSPATASAITYKVQMRITLGGTARIGFGSADSSDNSQAYPTSFTVTEVAD